MRIRFIILFTILIIGCEKQQASIPQTETIECFRGECVIRDKQGDLIMKFARIDTLGNQTVIVYKKLITCLSDSTFVLTQKP